MADREPGTEFDLAEHQFDHAVLLVFAPSDQDSRLRAQMEEFEGRDEHVRDRNLLICQVVARGDSRVAESNLAEDAADQLRDEHSVGPDEFVVLLLARGGYERLRKSTVVPAERIFDIVDGMPLRREESTEEEHRYDEPEQHGYQD